MQIKIINSDNTERYIYGVHDAEYTELCTKVGYTGVNPDDPTTGVEPNTMTEYSDGTVGALVNNDGKLNISNLWRRQTTKIAENGAITKQYYQMESDNTDLPFTLTSYDGIGQIIERIVTGSINVSEKTVSPLQDGIEFQAELTSFAATHSLQLPTHDMNDTKIGMVSVDYDGSTPTNIAYHLDER